MHKFLIHRKGDSVGVAIEDIPQGEEVEGAFLDSDASVRVTTNHAIPLGHKIALTDFAAGAKVIEYGVTVALTKTAIRTGDLVHVHNIRSARWNLN